MIYIDDKKLDIIDEKFFIGEFMNNGEEGYTTNISLSFINSMNKEKGYLNLSVGFEKDNNIKSFLNREYNGIPFHDNNTFIFFEIYDTEKFLDTEIESQITIKIKDIKDDKVEVYFELNDELIKIKYDGYLDINYSKMKVL